VTAPTARARPRWGIFLPLAAVVVVVDQLSKAWLTGLLDPGERQAVLGDLLRIVHGQNSGALFGLFQDQALLFGLVSLAVVAMIVAYHATSGRRPVLSVALGLLLGGAIGNMLDRFRLGHVVDWIDAGIGDLRFYTFNVADASITGAIVLLIVLALLGDRLDRSSDRPTGATADGHSEPVDA
jgi:signal peptidase II